MKRLLLKALLFLCFAINGKNFHHSTSSKITSYSKNNQLCLNTPRNFGTTHFIVGYDTKDASTISDSPKILVNEVDPIINGSSTHLIDASRQTQSFFTTIHDITSIILKLIEQAEKSITIAIFSLTDTRIADALLAAHKKGVAVTIIIDAGKMKERYSKTKKLVDNGISVWYYDHTLRPYYQKREWADPLMHHKCIVIDDKLVITGSANGTRASQLDNIENINILRDPLAVEEHCQEFIRLKKYCVKCKNSETVIQKK